ncbi:FirrV-1-D7 [Feldmannia irregularis virus a]|uniref:FirrV-1-D7 n=1 Tax=Feldmannia irregularis virus a TaxID=231992 RepID=Q6XLW2_9PHYC|nr:FirrV-1-D7 [Feldmannia irregularis virus a]AAR26949.1 FirrV-1-D7 [Feldmannia irregularis virus a]
MSLWCLSMSSDTEFLKAYFSQTVDSLGNTKELMKLPYKPGYYANHVTGRYTKLPASPKRTKKTAVGQEKRNHVYSQLYQLFDPQGNLKKNVDMPYKAGYCIDPTTLRYVNCDKSTQSSTSRGTGKKAGYILNPSTGRYVKKNGATGLFIRGLGPDPRKKRKSRAKKTAKKQRSKSDKESKRRG